DPVQALSAVTGKLRRDDVQIGDAVPVFVEEMGIVPADGKVDGLAGPEIGGARGLDHHRASGRQFHVQENLAAEVLPERDRAAGREVSAGADPELLRPYADGDRAVP